MCCSPTCRWVVREKSTPGYRYTADIALQSPHLNYSVKPPVIACFGEIALAIGSNFEKYFSVTMLILSQAAQGVLVGEINFSNMRGISTKLLFLPARNEY